MCAASGPLTWGGGEGKGFREALLWPTSLSEGSVKVWGASWLQAVGDTICIIRGGHGK